MPVLVTLNKIDELKNNAVEDNNVALLKYQTVLFPT
jgi:hypothetical protein